jgi:AraC-like DNA-binding protein/quercetin dioxygenase-like cupin family protein
MTQVPCSNHPPTFGRTLALLEVGDVLVREVGYSANTRIPLHAHDNAVFVFVIAGESSGMAGGATRQYQPSSLRSIPAGASHSNVFGDSPSRSLLIEPKPEIVERLRAHTQVLDRFEDFCPHSHAAMLGRRIYSEMNKPDSLRTFAIEGLALELMAAAGRAKAAASRAGVPEWLAAVREQLHDEFLSRLSVAKIANDYSVHPVHLARRFRAAFGCGPAEYVRRLRMQWAIEALRQPETNIAAVAQRAGFADQSHFTKAFKRATGLTPARFRETM